MSFNLLVLLSKNYAIDLGAGKLPWSDTDYMIYFDQLTKGGIIVMGRKTFESLPGDKRPFSDRLNVVLSESYGKYRPLASDQLIFCNMYILDNLVIPNNPNKPVWVIGGADVYTALSNRCTRMYVMHLDKAVPKPLALFPSIPPSFELSDYSEKIWSDTQQCNYRLLRYDRNFKSPCLNHESQYIRLVRDILSNGMQRPDRTNVGTIGLFGGQQRYDVSRFLPIQTTKFVPIKVIIKELLWFLRGDTDAKLLQAEGVHIWDGNSSADFLSKRGLPYEEGDIGPGYGFQWRHFGAMYTGCHDNYENQGVDQIANIIDMLKNDPFSRRIIMSAWNPTDLNRMALPPCHVLFQLYVEEDSDGIRYLSGHLYQRSQDVFLASSFNLVSYTVLLYILAKKVGYFPKEMIVSWGDVHIYSNHVDQANLQLSRQPLPQAILELSETIADKDFKDMTVDDFELVAYLHHPAIKADMAV